MTNRQLSDVEKKFASKNIKILEEDLIYKEQVQLKRKLLAIEVAPLEYAKQLKDMENDKKSLIKDIEELKSTLRILKEQIRNGVAIKNGE